jgi:hypothetical protein
LRAEQRTSTCAAAEIGASVLATTHPQLRTGVPGGMLDMVLAIGIRHLIMHVDS